MTLNKPYSYKIEKLIYKRMQPHRHTHTHIYTKKFINVKNKHDCKFITVFA